MQGKEFVFKGPNKGVLQPQQVEQCYVLEDRTLEEDIEIA